MLIIYLGSFVEKSQEKIFLENNTRITTSATTFQRALLNGFEPKKDVTFQIVNVPDIGSYPKRSLLLRVPGKTFKLNGIPGVNCPFLNLTYFKRFSIYRSVYKAMKELCEKNQGQRIVILVYSLIYPYIKAATKIKQKFDNVIICPIIADLPEYFGDKSSVIHNILSNNKAIRNLYKCFDSGVVLTQPMVEAVGLIDKPTLLVEGTYHPINIPTVTKVPKSIMYSGKLDGRFGIDLLLEAFTEIEDPEFSLWIFGDGTARAIVEEYAKKDTRITYFGYKPQQEVFEAQYKASILVNPRPNKGEYTKYSFPSKTMEYMASGTPVVMYKLDGIPDEYDPYLIYPQGDSATSLSRTLNMWGNKSETELREFGTLARNFILTEKNSNTQANKIINFLIENYG